jgi:hypothetical protein
MKNRNPLAVFFFGLFTGGIYSLYWNIVTKIDMNENGGTKIPSAFWLIIPFVNIWWYWEWSKGVEQVTNKKMGGGLSFILEMFLGPIGDAIIQDAFNKNFINMPSTNAPVAPFPDSPPPNPIS